jgi:hypothetical protein
MASKFEVGEPTPGVKVFRFEIHPSGDKQKTLDERLNEVRAGQKDTPTMVKKIEEPTPGVKVFALGTLPSKAS